MYEIFEELLKKHNVTPYRVAKETGITTATFTSWKQGKYTPKQDKLQKIADYFGVKIDYLMGTEKETDTDEDKPYYALTDKDDKDIAKELERLLADLESSEALAFHGEPMDEETKRLFAISLENSLRLGREMAKKKFTPKKYRD
ncbi:helix-turn-helix domain-containing protein [Paenibacillus odorifer]|uniref:Transcriptional regulator n=1 Tax=Paenibacillus odorifer TaxID=189426 RepID=A0A1R0X9B7_9BACL|nr:helix-turn-helix transcriptional regulator [Paenibacillus odorifer]OMD31336.1 transcriptional regulator [Paenibacillus odorifer]